jgi:RNA polymerase sigma factor for flagellar operon FliA
VDKEWAVKKFTPLIRKLAYDLAKSLPPSVEVEDLIQEGVVGLLGALERFDPSRHVKLSTYVVTRIRGAMLDYLRSIDWMPRTLRKKLKAVERARMKFINEEPEMINSKIAEELGIEEKEVKIVEREILRNQILSLNKYLLSDEEMEDLIPSQDRTPEELYEDEEMIMKLKDAIDSLTDREKLLLSLYYYEDLTFKEIAEILAVSESRVCQIHSVALSKIRDKLKGMR